MPSKFIGSHLRFFKKFPDDYKALKSNPPYVLIGMNDNLLLRVLMFEDVDRGRRV